MKRSLTPTRLRHSLIALGILAAIAGSACSGEEADPGSSEAAATDAEKNDLLDVNDVSILFAIDKKGTPFPEYKLTGDKGLLGFDLLPVDVVNQITTAATKQKPAIEFQNGGNKADTWRIFGMRLDPCAPGIRTDAVKGADGNLDKSKCLVQVRLIAQPLGQGSPQDISMHVVYTIGTLDQLNLDDIRADVAKIKLASIAAGVPTAGQPLGVHPGLAKAKTGVRDAVTAFLKKYVPQQKQLALAFMGLESDGAEPWEFFAGAVVPLGPDGKPSPTGKPTFLNLADLRPAGMPNLPAKTRNIVFQPFSQPKIAPAPAGLSTAPLFSANDDKDSVAFKIENAATTHFFSADCVSCHTSTQKGFSFQTKSNANRVRVPAGITGYASPTVQQNSSWNLRNFGYFDTSPSVSLRTVNETVEVVQQLNEGHLSKDPKAAKFFGPGNDCTAVDDAVFDCFLTNADAKGGSTCMTKCAPFPLDAAPAPPDSKPDPLKPLPDASKDPCKAAPEASELTVAGKTITVKGKATECFSRSFPAFKIHNPDPSDKNDPKVEIACRAGTNCFATVSSLTGPTAIAGRDAQRLRFLLGKVSADHTFVANAKNGTLTFACTDDAAGKCTITPALK
jgi:hypothetical protein